jgi:hypothetical protein
LDKPLPKGFQTSSGTLAYEPTIYDGGITPQIACRGISAAPSPHASIRADAIPEAAPRAPPKKGSTYVI